MKGWDERQGLGLPFFVNQRYVKRNNFSGMLSGTIAQVRCGSDYNPEPSAHRTSNRSGEVGLVLGIA